MSLHSRIPERLTAIGVAIGLVIVAYGGGNVAGFGVNQLLTVVGADLSLRQNFLLSVLVLQLVFFTGVSLAYLNHRSWSPSSIGIRRPSLEGWIVLGAGFIGMLVLWFFASIASAIVSMRLGIEQEAQGIFEMGQQDPFIFVLLAIVSLLIVGPTEELLFRGVIQSRLRESYGIVPGLVLATALFAFIHVGGFELSAGGLLSVSVLFFVGLVFAVCYEYTGNLVVVAIMHGLFNATQAMLAYFGFRFSDPEAMVVILSAVTAV